MLDLPQDIIGSNPKYLPIVDHSWLNPQNYDNYPSDNNPIRVQPKLAELWGTGKDTGIHLVPNLTVQQLGIRATESASVDNIIRETKKAMMMGLKGKALVNHIKSRFSSEDIKKADQELKKVSEELGLLGNVYIDASAFVSAVEADQFFSHHRNRLARDIIVNDSKLNPAVISYLASKFHKNIVSNITYDEDLFKKYKMHMVSAGQISENIVIDSKETLREAFLSEPEKKEVVKTPKKEDIKIPLDVTGALGIKATMDKDAQEEILYGKLRPIIIFARQNFVKGKTGSNLKEMLKKKFVAGDLNKAVKYLAAVLSKTDLSDKIDNLISTDRMISKIGKDLKNIIKSFPLIKSAYEKPQIKESVGVQGFFYSMNNRDPNNAEFCDYAKGLLRKGCTLEEVQAELSKKVPEGDVDRILSAAINEFNLTSVVKANTFVKAKKEKMFEDVEEKPVLPDPQKIQAQTQEILDFFKGGDNTIKLNDVPNNKPLDIEMSGVANYESIL